MKKKLKLKPYIIPSIYILVITIFAVSAMQKFEDVPEPLEDIRYVSNVIFSNEVPVISTDTKEIVVIRPYTDTEVKIVKDFYDFQADEEKQQNSIIYYESTYLQNSGIAYGGKEEAFDVVSILDGTVVSVKEDNTLGKIVEVRHSNDIVSVYQSLSEITDKENDEIKQGTIIGKSGSSNISKELNNHLHFELIIKGQIVNPENYYDKKVDEL